MIPEAVWEVLADVGQRALPIKDQMEAMGFTAIDGYTLTVHGWQGRVWISANSSRGLPQ